MRARRTIEERLRGILGSDLTAAARNRRSSDDFHERWRRRDSCVSIQASVRGQVQGGQAQAGLEFFRLAQNIRIFPLLGVEDQTLLQGDLAAVSGTVMAAIVASIPQSGLQRG